MKIPAPVLAAALLACGPAALAAEESGMPSELAAKVAALGRVIDPPKTAVLYAPLQEKEPYKGVIVVRDVPYGPDGGNLLDVFSPQAAGAPRPVLIYVHGGGFVGGSKHMPGSPFYDNIHLWAVRHGMVGVNMTYRLAPAAKWPAGAQDVGRALQWVRANIASHGGDPQRIYVMGNSAGAILLSGVYDLTTFDAGGLKVYFGDNVEAYVERSPIHGLLMSRVPLIVSQTELDPSRSSARRRSCATRCARARAAASASWCSPGTTT